MDNSTVPNSLFTVQKQQTTSIDNEDNTQNIIMNHLHSVKSLKKFFETKMVVQCPAAAAASVQSTSTMTSSQPIITNNEQQKFDRSLINKEQKSNDEFEQRQEMMNKVLESLKKKKAYSRTALGKISFRILNIIYLFIYSDTPELSGRCSAMTNSSYDSTITQNLAVQRHYSRRFRSSSTSNNSLYPGGNIITHINLSNSHHNKRAYSQERQHYQTTDHQLSNIDKWKQDQQQQRQIDSDEEDNISENSMLWQARTKLNEFVIRSKTKHRINPSDDIYTYDDDSVTAETRF
jgi:hypothetical protein